MRMLLCERERYLVKLAETGDEVKQALSLRYRVFKEEQGKQSGLSGALDQDRFDRYYRHLLVIERRSGAVIGTYRVGVPEELPPGMGLYSQREFRIFGLPERKGTLLDVGRSCVAPEARSGTAMVLLWSGLAELCRRLKRSFLLGCASFDGDEDGAALALAFYEGERRGKRLCPELSAEPEPEFQLAVPAGKERSWEAEERVAVDFRRLPPLVKGYLRLGGRVCSPPAWDREFGSIDLLVGCNLKNMTEKYAHHFHL